jgi:hypothetical protein
MKIVDVVIIHIKILFTFNYVSLKFIYFKYEFHFKMQGYLVFIFDLLILPPEDKHTYSMVQNIF